MKKSSFAMILGFALVPFVILLAWFHDGRPTTATSGHPSVAEPWVTLGVYHPDNRPTGALSAEPFKKFGHNGAVGNTFETLWEEGGLYAWPPGAVAMTISSSSASDTGAGVGAQAVDVYALDASLMVLPVQTIATNGQLGVAVPINPARISQLIVSSVGSSGANVGTIYIGAGPITAGKPATVYGLISASPAGAGNEINADELGWLSVPADAIAYVHSIGLSGSDDYNFRLKQRSFSGPYAGIWRTGFQGDAVGFDAELIRAPFALPPGDYEIQVRSLGGPSIGVGASLRYDLYRNVAP